MEEQQHLCVIVLAEENFEDGVVVSGGRSSWNSFIGEAALWSIDRRAIERNDPKLELALDCSGRRHWERG